MVLLEKEVSSKIRAAVKSKLIDIGAYVDEELPEYIMAMVTSKRSKAQMTEDLQLFLGKNTDQFAEWLQQLVGKHQNTSSGNTKTLTGGTEKLSNVESVETSKEKHTTQKSLIKKAAPEQSAKRTANVIGGTVSVPSKISTQVASVKPAPMSVVTVPAKVSASTPQNSKQSLRRVVTAPSSVVTVVNKRPTDPDQHTVQSKRLKINSFMALNDGSGRILQSTTEEIGNETLMKRKNNSGFRVTDRLGIRPGKGINIKERLGVRKPNSIGQTAAQTLSPRFAGRLGTRNTISTETDISIASSNRMSDRLGARNSNEMLGGTMDRPERPKITERLGIRKYNTPIENQEFPTRGSDYFGKRSAELGDSDVTLNKPPNDSRGSKLAQRLRELAESSSSISLGTRVAHVPPNVRQSDITSKVNRRPAINSQIVSTASRIMASHKPGQQNSSEDNDMSPEVAVPSVVRVTPRPRLPASMQANKNLLLKAVAEAQRSVAEAAVSAALPQVASVLRRAKAQEPQEQLEDTNMTSLNQADEEVENPEKLEDQFLLSFHNRENFAVTVSNNTAPEEMDVSETEEEFSEELPDELHVTTSSSNSEGASRVVVATIAESREAQRPFIGTEKSQKITIQLSPEGSQEGDSSSEREVSMDTPTHNDIMKDKEEPGATLFSEPMIVDEEDEAEEEEESATSVAAVRPTVVTAVPHMDMEPTSRINPQFVVTLDGLDLSMFPNSSIDDYENGLEPSSVINQDFMKEESAGSVLSNSSVSTGRATIIRVEPRLRLGPLPTQQQEEKNTTHSTDSNVTTASSNTASKTMERCKFWPVCRMGDKCNYHHPTQPCRAFPACKFGDKCLYVHPNCKFDAACTRRDCPYTHASPRLATSILSAAQGIPRTGNIQAVCRFFPNCSNPACKFLHPKACKYGRYCVKPGCTFQHGAVPSTDKLKWVCPFRA